MGQVANAKETREQTYERRDQSADRHDRRVWLDSIFRRLRVHNSLRTPFCDPAYGNERIGWSPDIGALQHAFDTFGGAHRAISWERSQK